MLFAHSFKICNIKTATTEKVTESLFRINLLKKLLMKVAEGCNGWEQLQQMCAASATGSSCKRRAQMQLLWAAAATGSSCNKCAQQQLLCTAATYVLSCDSVRSCNRCEQLQQLAVRCYRSTQPRLSLNRLTVVNRERGREKGNMSWSLKCLGGHHYIL